MKDYRIEDVLALAATGRLRGSNEDDIFLGDQFRDVYFGRGGNDDIVGNQGNDFLNGGSGGDVISAGYGDDRVIGGSGDDKLSGDSNTDRITGGGGGDEFRFRAWGNLGGGSNVDIITDFDPRGRGDYIFLNLLSDFGVSTFAQLKAGMFQDGDDVVMNFAGIDFLVLENTRINQLHRDDFQLFVT